MLRDLHVKPLSTTELDTLERLLEKDPYQTLNPLSQWALLGAYANHLAETLGWFDRDYLHT